MPHRPVGAKRWHLSAYVRLQELAKMTNLSLALVHVVSLVLVSWVSRVPRIRWGSVMILALLLYMMLVRITAAFGRYGTCCRELKLGCTMKLLQLSR